MLPIAPDLSLWQVGCFYWCRPVTMGVVSATGGNYPTGRVYRTGSAGFAARVYGSVPAGLSEIFLDAGTAEHDVR